MPGRVAPLDPKQREARRERGQQVRPSPGPATALCEATATNRYSDPVERRTLSKRQVAGRLVRNELAPFPRVRLAARVEAQQSDVASLLAARCRPASLLDPRRRTDRSLALDARRVDQLAANRSPGRAWPSDSRASCLVRRKPAPRRSVSALNKLLLPTFGRAHQHDSRQLVATRLARRVAR